MKKRADPLSLLSEADMLTSQEIIEYNKDSVYAGEEGPGMSYKELRASLAG